MKQTTGAIGTAPAGDNAGDRPWTGQVTGAAEPKQARDSDAVMTTPATARPGA